MVVKKKILSKADVKFIQKYACKIEGCDENFVFKTTVEKLNATDEFGKTYQAVCSNCGKRTLMTKANMKRWQTIFTGGKFEISETTFNKFFE